MNTNCESGKVYCVHEPLLIHCINDFGSSVVAIGLAAPINNVYICNQINIQVMALQ